jgi:peptidoglycan/LPS O-acetylase OafA/YrhL
MNSAIQIEPKLHGHIPALDAIRGLAILLVTIYRFGGTNAGFASAGKHVLPFLSLGTHGVDLFFVLSGFLITGILYDAKSQDNYFLNFYARRTLRIFPLYYAVLLLVLVLSPKITDAHAHATWLWLYGANVIQSISGQWCLGSLNHFWSLAVEEHFYLVWPLVIYSLSRRQAMITCAVLFVASPLARAAWCLSGGNDVAPQVFTLFRLDGLCAGAFLALAVREGAGILQFVRSAKILLGLSLLLLLPITYKELRLLYFPDTLWVIASSCLLILTLAASSTSLWGKMGKSHILQWLGKYSYGMYVFQNLLIPACAGIFTAGSLAQHFGSPVLGQLCYLVIMSALTAALAVVSWYGFEKHLLGFKRYFGGHSN